MATPRFEKTGKVIERGISGIIYADPGVGKTTLLSTLPPDETLIIMAEAGIGPLLGKNHTIFRLNENLSQLEELYLYLRTQKNPFVNICLDNASEMEDWFVTTLTQGRNKDFAELSEYGNAAYKLREYIHLFRDLTELGKNVFITAWEMNYELKNSAGEVLTKTAPKFFKKILPDICGVVDFIAHLEMYDKTGDRWMRLAPKHHLIAKCQFKGPDSEEPANLPQLINKIKTFDYTLKEDL